MLQSQNHFLFRYLRQKILANCFFPCSLLSQSVFDSVAGPVMYSIISGYNGEESGERCSRRRAGDRPETLTTPRGEGGVTPAQRWIVKLWKHLKKSFLKCFSMTKVSSLKHLFGMKFQLERSSTLESKRELGEESKFLCGKNQLPFGYQRSNVSLVIWIA